LENKILMHFKCKKMKQIICLLIGMMMAGSVAAQFNTTLRISTTPPGTLSEWGYKKEVFTFLVITQGGSAPKPVKIKAELKLTDGTVIANVDLARAAVFNFTPGNTILNAFQAMPLENMIFTGKYKKALERTGKLPADNYQLCLRLVSATDLVPVSEEKCGIFVIASMQLPIAVMPYDGSTIDANTAQTAITFRWTPLVPRPSTPVTYRVQAFEVLPAQTPMQAFRSNPPLLDREVRATTQYIWQPQISMDDTDSLANKGMGKKFIWTIQTLDATGLPVSDGNVNGDGRSEPIVFYVKKKKLRAQGTQ
jgi:hypothetical protein